MSADAIVVCPRCYPDDYTVSGGINDGCPNQLRENYEFYFEKGIVVAEYRGDCWECGYHIEFVHREPLPGMPS